MVIQFSRTSDPTGVEVYDPITQRRLHVRTPSNGPLRTTDTDRFCFPVDAAYSVETKSLVFDQRYVVDLHDAEGQSNGTVEDAHDIGGDTQFLGLTGPIKLYCRVDDPGTVEVGIDSVHLSFDRPSVVEIGARSLHERPAGTIRTPDDPEAMMEAIAALSSSLKTTSPERSWPTLRGHPPLIERGQVLEIPDLLRLPETDVSIVVPPNYRDVYAVAPLSFYFGATIEPGRTRRLETAERSYELGVERSLEDDVARVLKRTFVLDCVVRTEGLYRYELQERSDLEPHLPFDVSETYGLSLSDQLDRYLSVPHDVVEPYIPRWPLTAHVPARPDGVSLLPYIVNELGIVREARGTTVDPTIESHPTGQVVRSASEHRTPVVTSTIDERSKTFIEPDVIDDSIEHAWFGDHIPRGASKSTIEAYENQLSRTERNDSIEILLVCNDVRMLEEHDLLDDVYGNRETLPFSIDSEFGVSTDELASLLTGGGYDFLHYIGHATPTGLQCPDGELDVRSLSTIDVGVFFLNACQSYEQGLALTKRGAFGGITTLGDIVNEHAVTMGETIARLLNLGFPLRAALELAKDTTILGDQYLIVGDGSTDIAQSEGGAPAVLEYKQVDSRLDIQFSFYPTKEFKLGVVTHPTIKDDPKRMLTPNVIQLENVATDELRDHLVWVRTPVLINGSFVWNDLIGSPTLQ